MRSRVPRGSDMDSFKVEASFLDTIKWQFVDGHKRVFAEGRNKEFTGEV